MSIKGRTDLKSEFENGKRATAEKFEDLIDSSFNQYEDSLLLGPIGITGKRGLLGPDGLTSFNGLIGPVGATHYIGLWLDSGATTVNGPTSSGTSGQVVIGSTSVYICYSNNNWIKIQGETSF